MGGKAAARGKFQLLESKMTKKKLEEDSQLLRNRIALLRVRVCGGEGAACCCA